MQAIKNDRLLRALNNEPVDCTPVWLMRQAGRYLPEYRATRAKAGNFLNLCKTPELACEVTLQPLRRFALDAAILFSDILTIPDAMGLGLYFTEGEGPRFTKKIKDANDIVQLSVPDPEIELRYVLDSVRLIKKELQAALPLIGFSGSPWTLATYMLEGGSSKNFHASKGLLYREPLLMQQLLKKLTEAIILYLKAQIAAGCDAVMLFDTWGGALTTEAYQRFSLHYMAEIIAALKSSSPEIPVILFTKGSGLWLEMIAQSGCNAIGIDWMTDIKQARERIPSSIAIQGNLDPAILLASPERIKAEVKKLLDAYGPKPGHIFNLGHGITPDIDPEHVAVLVEAVHNHR